MNTPALLVPRLSREPQAGSIALGGFLPAGVPGEGPIARFTNVVVRPGVVVYNLAAAPNAPARSGSRASAAADMSPAAVIRAWSLSKAFVPEETAAVPSIPGPRVLGEFQRVDAEPSGLVQLYRHVRAPESGRVAAVARVRVRAERAGLYTFDLGFSDVATVFLNGRPIFRGDGSYSFDRPRREGLIGFDNAQLYLPLAAGENELAVLVTDSFGGWGLMGRFLGKGLRVEGP